jgi:phospholipid/cholesterol/gamma-HCH transport system ATP-binding protein
MGEGEAQDFRVALDGVHLRLGDRPVFEGLTCGFPRGRISVVLGGSGVGKSTLLRLIGGLVRPDSGSVRVAGVDVTQLSETQLFRVRDSIGMLFQGGALLDSMSIFENVALPLREHREYKKLSEADVAAEVGRRLAAVGLPDAGPLYPRQLSGGMNRRAALARAIITDPEVLLVDEPFSGLDPVNVRRIEDLLVELNERLHLTMVVTSHHIDSTFRMAHRIVFLAGGGAAVQGSPRQVLGCDDARVVEFRAAEGNREAARAGACA